MNKLTLANRFKNAFNGFRGRDYTEVQIKDLMSTMGLWGNTSNSLNETGAYREIVTAYACINAIKKAVASVPLYFYRGKNQIKSGTETEILDYPNPNLSFRRLMTQVEMWLLIKGMAFIWHDPESEIFWVLPANLMTPVNPQIYPQNFWLYQVNQRQIPKEQLIIFQKDDSTGANTGLSPLTVALDTTNLDKKSKQHIIKFFENFAMIGAVLSSKEHLTDPQYQQVLDQFTAQRAGSDNAFKTLLLNTEFKLDKFQANLNELDLSNLRGEIKEDVCISFGVPPAVIGIHKYSNYANAKEQMRMFWQNTILTELREIQDTFTLYLQNNFDKSCYAEYDLMDAPVLAEIEREKGDYYKNQVLAGLYTINDVRGFRGEEPYEWGNTPPPSFYGRGWTEPQPAQKDESVANQRKFEKRLSRQENKLASILKEADKRKGLNIDEKYKDFTRAIKSLFTAIIKDAGDEVLIESDIDKELELTPDIQDWISKTIEQDINKSDKPDIKKIILAVNNYGSARGLEQIERNK